MWAALLCVLFIPQALLDLSVFLIPSPFFVLALGLLIYGGSVATGSPDIPDCLCCLLCSLAGAGEYPDGAAQSFCE